MADTSPQRGQALLLRYVVLTSWPARRPQPLHAGGLWAEHTACGAKRHEPHGCYTRSGVTGFVQHILPVFCAWTWLDFAASLQH
jgi:hypothetical protein